MYFIGTCILQVLVLPDYSAAWLKHVGGTTLVVVVEGI
jgi:hypothetical protein